MSAARCGADNHTSPSWLRSRYTQTHTQHTRPLPCLLHAPLVSALYSQHVSGLSDLIAFPITSLHSAAASAHTASQDAHYVTEVHRVTELYLDTIPNISWYHRSYFIPFPISDSLVAGRIRCHWPLHDIDITMMIQIQSNSNSNMESLVHTVRIRCWK